MAKTLAEDAMDDFKVTIEALLIRKGWTADQLADRLGCSTKTVSLLRNDPSKVRGHWILIVNKYYRELEKRLDKEREKNYVL